MSKDAKGPMGQDPAGKGLLGQVTVGRLVISLKGRDKERVFMITGVIDENYVTIADGSLRKLENAKKKKIKHLAPFGTASDRIAEKLRDGKKITNAELRKMIKGLDDAPIGGSDKESPV